MTSKTISRAIANLTHLTSVRPEASDGLVFAFNTTFAGSCPGIDGCSAALVAVPPDARGNGYWPRSSSPPHNAGAFCFRWTDHDHQRASRCSRPLPLGRSAVSTLSVAPPFTTMGLRITCHPAEPGSAVFEVCSVCTQVRLKGGVQLTVSAHMRAVVLA